MDLTGTEVTIGDDGSARVVFTARDNIPSTSPNDDSALWVVQLYSGDGSQYMLDATLIGEEWFVSVYDWQTSAYTEVKASRSPRGTSSSSSSLLV